MPRAALRIAQPDLGVLCHWLYCEQLDGLKEIEKLVTGKTGLFKDCEKSPSLERSAVERNGNDAWALLVSVETVGTSGMVKKKSSALQNPNDICRGRCG